MDASSIAKVIQPSCQLSLFICALKILFVICGNWSEGIAQTLNIHIGDGIDVIVGRVSSTNQHLAA